MCLGIPARVVKVEGGLATLDVLGEERHARLDLLDVPVSEGDWVLERTGLVMEVLTPDEAEETLVLIRQLLAAQAA